MAMLAANAIATIRTCPGAGRSMPVHRFLAPVSPTIAADPSRRSSVRGSAHA